MPDQKARLKILDALWRAGHTADEATQLLSPWERHCMTEVPSS
ncbi:hypothetical protein AB0903_31150 [Streptomyces sp. NPDC048389]